MGIHNIKYYINYIIMKAYYNYIKVIIYLIVTLLVYYYVLQYESITISLCNTVYYTIL